MWLSNVDYYFITVLSIFVCSAALNYVSGQIVPEPGCSAANEVGNELISNKGIGDLRS